MPELRKDPVIGRWVIISTERGKRPMEFPPRIPWQSGGFCPFCQGNEDRTPPEVYAKRDQGGANGPGWEVRVVPNKFPALIIEGALERRGEGLYDVINGIGAHEVIIDSNRHDAALADLSHAELEQVISSYQHRLKDLERDSRFRYILIFKNHGAAAGATLEHSHTQLIATPIIPKRVVEELEGAQAHWDNKERCIYCDIIGQELKDGQRLIGENDRFVALAPFASRCPFETWILPKTHAEHFSRIDGTERGPFAELLSTVLRKLKVALDDPAYNFVMHTAPINDDRRLRFHWHLEIMPKLTKVAGFEWGSGFYINPTPPEEAAAYLRDLKLEE